MLATIEKDWIQQILGIKITPSDKRLKNYPNFIHTRYQLEAVHLDNQEAVFIYPKESQADLSSMKKHIRLIWTEEKVPCVIIFKTITTYRRDILLKEHIPFIVERSQIYLPFLGTYIQRKCTQEKYYPEKILPSAQLLLLFFIYNWNRKISLTEAAGALLITPMSISRAARQLESLSLVKSYKEGKSKIIFSDLLPKELFEKALPFLESPVRRKIYIPKGEIKDSFVKSGLSALAEYSMLTLPKVPCYATTGTVEWNNAEYRCLVDSDEQVQVELWKYDPTTIAKDSIVDRLSLYLSLRKETDERTEQALAEMLEAVWEELDGKWARQLQE